MKRGEHFPCKGEVARFSCDIQMLVIQRINCLQPKVLKLLKQR